MKLIKHEYKSLNECLHAMIQGVVFHYQNQTISYNSAKTRFIVGHYDQAITGYEDVWHEWTIQAEPDWRDDLPKGKRIPCEAWDDDVVEKRFDFIHSYVDGDCYPYKGTVDDYTHATPIQDKDCWRAE